MSESVKFVHLHCHSEFSLLECPFRINQIVSQAKEYEMPAVALTDNAVMYGVIDFYQKALKAGVKPIIGCDMFLAKDITVKERGLDRLILLAKDLKGYQNLVELVSTASIQGFYYRPRIDIAHLSQFSEGLICISPGGNGPVGYRIQSNNSDDAREVAQSLKDVYGSDFYLGIQRLDQPYEDLVIDESKQLSESLGIPLVVTNDVYYLNRERAPLRNVLQCIQTGRSLEENTRLKFQTHEAYFKSPEDMIQLFSDFPEAIANTVKIAEDCNVELQMDQVSLPHFTCPDNLTDSAYLEKLVWEGIHDLYEEITPEIKDRVGYELGIIQKMGYAPYFLIIYDFLDFCTRNDIPVGPGRGSAAGSIVSYALYITRIDPLKYNLLFERFLNPERISMPDVDIDFCIRRRGEVIQYISDAYGEDRVAQIITFGTMAARGVVRDVGRVLNVPLSDVDRIAKLIPSAPGHYTSIPEALEQVPDLAKIAKQEDFKELIQTGIQLEGVARHHSTHAAGVVISRDPLKTIVPLINSDGQMTTQFSMADLEKIGLLKMDILGLRNLTVMHDAVTLIKKNHGVEIDINELDMTDEPTYDLLCTGESAGVFQLESRGMRQLIKDMQPRVFEDIIALLALYRPGPLGSGMVQDFVSNKSGKTKVKYDLDILEPILQDTYGMIVYQEQVMQIASAVGGFSLGQADMLRKAMGKKKKDVMDEMRIDFLDGAKNKEIDVGIAEKIFDLCYKFAEYGFNKSHSAAYAFISFQTAYLKAHYPQEYMCALLSSVLGVADKISIYIEESNRMGIPVLPPDVNSSEIDFTITDEGIRFGLAAIKNVGEGAIESIVEQRQSGGPYKDLSDFCLRVDLRQVNKRVIESLIKSGSMDQLEERSKLLGCYEGVLEQAQIVIKERMNGQTNMFDQIGMTSGIHIDESWDSYAVFSEQELLRMEKEMIGLYISGHPLDSFQKHLDSMPIKISEIDSEQNGQIVEVMGLLTDTRRMITRTKKEMVIGTLEDTHANMSILAFQGDGFDQIVEAFIDDAIVKAKGRIRIKGDEISLSIDQLILMDSLGQNRQLHIDVDHVEDLSLFKDLQKLCRESRGTMPLYFHLSGATVVCHKKYWVTDDESVHGRFEKLMGSGKVWISG